MVHKTWKKLRAVQAPIVEIGLQIFFNKKKKSHGGTYCVALAANQVYMILKKSVIQENATCKSMKAIFRSVLHRLRLL